MDEPSDSCIEVDTEITAATSSVSSVGAGFGEDSNFQNGGESFPKDAESIISKNSLTEIQHNMLERLSKNTQVMVRSQQRDEPDLSAEQKLDALKAIFETHPDQFLVRFGKFLKASDSECFEHHRRGGDYNIVFHLSEVEKSWKAGADEKTLKNRRYEALKRLVETTDYFSEEEMQRRNPILYDQLIGKYHTEEERHAFLQQSWKSTSGSGTTSMPLTDLFLAHMERTEDGISCRRRDQEFQQEEEDEADAEYDSDDEDYDMENEQPGPSKRSGKSSKRQPTVNDDDEGREEIEEEEKDLLKEEFFTTMYRNFLNGKDEDFDYSTVDGNPEYDCGENLENDEEEKYFDDEEPCEVSEPNSDLDDLFRPPVRSGEIESKIQQLSVENEPTPNREESVSSTQPTVTAMLEDDEDELDAYMKEIEKQLQQ
ncbi:Coiled-coil domain-containing protein 97 [Orchesella cincta]|uniref:Coiled-coil domain-containing protein 97 n=1 Tax=Orchesella cincta TaxID=48709 RepID=A0A1D2N8T4_ORCCI|nr:Coiled-coil domain-containing protein 97 [Orchesella cincta]